MSLRRVSYALGAAAVAVLAAACGSSTGLAPFQPQINNVADNFQFQATGVTDVSGTYTYAWSNTGDSATVNQATTITAGTATVSVFDANGTQVYSASLSGNGTFGVMKGVAGSWTVKVVLVGYSGTRKFRAQKA